LLEATAFAPGGIGYDQAFGYGRVDAFAAVTAAASYVPPPDTTPPTITMNSPVQGGTVSGTAVVAMTATDDVGVAKVDLYVDGVFFVSDGATPYSIAWDTSALPNGPHTLQAVATDAANNSASTATITVTVSNTPPDTTPPTVSIGAPAAGATVSGTATVSASASDNVAVAKVELFVDGVLNATDTTAPYSFAWNTTASSNGAHTLKVVATDTAGNSANVTRTVTVANNVNHAPVAVNDAFSAPYRAATSYTAQVFAVLANDSDADGNLNPASVKIVGSPNKGGAVTVKTNGSVSYTPMKGYRGAETFTYNVKDSLGATSNTATVTVTVQ
jgi:Bacterial Ig domain